MNNKELYKLSKKVYKESLLHAQLQASGSNQAKFLERIEKDASAVSAQGVIMKILTALYIVVLTLVPIRSIIVIRSINSLPEYSTSWNTFAGGLSISGFILLQPIILLVFSILSSWGLTSGGPYRWLHTLPLSQKEIEKVSLFTFFRGTNVQMIVMAFILPLGSFIGAIINLPGLATLSSLQIFLISFASLIISFIGTIFNLSIIVISARKMALIMEEHDIDNKKANFIRIFTVIIYLIASMVMMYSVQLAIEKVPLLYAPENQFMSDSVSLTANSLLSFIPFPFSVAYLLTSLTIGVTKMPILVLIGSSMGTIVYGLIAYLLYKKALSTLRTITFIKRKSYLPQSSKITLEQVKIQKTNSIKAFLKRDLSLISREIQALIYLIMPIMLPIVTLITDFDYNPIWNTIMTEDFIFKMFYVILLTVMLVTGVTNVESGGETITSSLPIRVRDQVKSKIPYFFGPIPLAYLISYLSMLGKENFLSMLKLGLAFLPVLPILGISGLFFKVLLFGKMEYKYVVEEINNNSKILKYILLFVFICLIAASFIFLSMVGYWALFLLEAVSLLILYLVFNLMFPKQ